MTTEYASFDDLTAAATEPETQDVPLPSGKTVKVRGISRYEWMLIGKRAEGDGNTAETMLIAMATVQPALSEPQVEQWRKRPGAMHDVEAVADAIRDLSGLGEGADKSAVAEVRD